MDCICDTFFSIWLNEAETAQVDAHVKENFIYAEYENTEKEKKLVGAINRVTREIMWADPVPVVHLKCLFVLIGNPFHMTIRFGMMMVRGIVLVIHAVFTLDGQKFCGAILDVLAVPFYGVGIELAALTGLFYDSLKGRERLGLMEKKLNWNLEVGDERAFFLAHCCQPWVYNIDNTQGKYNLTRTASSYEALGYENPYKGCPLLTDRSICCFVA